MDKSKDQDRGKGAMEQDQQNQGGNTSMQGQLGHRDEDEELKNADADVSSIDTESAPRSPLAGSSSATGNPTSHHMGSGACAKDADEGAAILADLRLPLLWRPVGEGQN